MWESVLAALITGVLTLIGVLVSNGRAQAVTETKLEELTREVREHNGFARRMPVVEEQIKVMNHRISDLEKAGYVFEHQMVYTINDDGKSTHYMKYRKVA